jgi:hypothetical protein
MKKYLAILSLGYLLFTPVYAQALDLGLDGENVSVKDVALGAGYDETTDEKTLARNVGLIVRAAMSLLGIIFTALLVYAGFNWMIARGEEEKVKKSQEIIKMAIIGLIVTVAAYSITYFVMSALLGPETPVK